MSVEGAKSPASETKDLEGVSDAQGAAARSQDGQSSRPAGGAKRQKKIAVLTSGGDSAGMNAAGELTVAELGANELMS